MDENVNKWKKDKDKHIQWKVNIKNNNNNCLKIMHESGNQLTRKKTLFKDIHPYPYSASEKIVH